MQVNRYVSGARDDFGPRVLLVEDMLWLNDRCWIVGGGEEISDTPVCFLLGSVCAKLSPVATHEWKLREIR